MIWRTLASGLLAVLVAFGADIARAAQPDPAGHREVTAISPHALARIATDERRYVAYLDASGTPRVWDTRTGGIHSIEGADGCAPGDVGGGRVLLVCPRTETLVSFIDDVPWDRQDSGYRARTASVLGGASAPLRNSKWMARAHEIGRHWVKIDPFCFSSSSSSCSEMSMYTTFMNWRTGKYRSFPPRPGDFRARDLDSPNLVGLEPRSNVETAGIKRSGGKDIRVGDPWVTWMKGSSVKAFNYETGQRFKRRFGSKGARIAPVRAGLVIARPIGDRDGGHAYRLKLIHPR